MSCCPIDQSDNACYDISRDTSKCAKLAECCVGIHDSGLQRQCLERVRECQQLGNAFDPIAPLKPLDAKFMFTDRPGYTTQGDLVLERFGSFAGLSFECILKGMFCGLLVALLIKYLLKTDLSWSRIIGVSLLASVIQCMLKTFD